ncbi:UDP-2,3-diacylglucosamine pyrophosphatase LpxH [Salinibacter ruber]|uniref:hypothetical protein n=1 Tax=Salinibacter ruber TaxID=146919 RepID=UPI00216715AA|nr:hypothetical protein [Salinibacter ruber]MCS4139585.1 UDP-2,3-diacylglucosamine pyrophosphatase LpxH [Salinibacter ruber]
MDQIADHFPHEDLEPSEHEDYPHHLTTEEAQRLADFYCIDNETMRACKEEFDLAHDEWMCFRQVHSLRHSQPTVVDPERSIDEAVKHLTQRQKRQATERKAKRKHRRERDKAARKWWELEEALEEAATAFEAESYDPPRLRVRMAEQVETEAAGVLNLQDLHLGARPADAEGFSVKAYRESILRRVETALEDAARLRKLDRIYVIGGADLVHSDTAGGQTASGTELEMACSTSTALQHAIQLLAQVVDMARQVAQEVTIVPIHGNHDRTEGVAAAMAAGQRFHSADNVESMDLAERQYATYAGHLLCMTHGDLTKKRMRKMGEIMRSEARGLYGRTEWSSLFVGHLHHKAMDMVDESGRVIYQTPTPVPIDSYHDREGYVGSRKGIQLVLLDRDDGGDRIIHA